MRVLVPSRVVLQNLRRSFCSVQAATSSSGQPASSSHARAAASDTIQLEDARQVLRQKQRTLNRELVHCKTTDEVEEKFEKYFGYLARCEEDFGI